MKITLNNISETFAAEQLSITDLLSEKKYTFKLLVIKINGQLIKREDYPRTIVHDGDDVMILHLMSGG